MYLLLPHCICCFSADAGVEAARRAAAARLAAAAAKKKAEEDAVREAQAQAEVERLAAADEEEHMLAAQAAAARARVAKKLVGHAFTTECVCCCECMLCIRVGSRLLHLACYCVMCRLLAS